MNMEGFFLCYGDETPGSVEPTGEHASCFVGGSSECLAQGSPKYLFVQPALRPIKTLLRTSRFGNKKIHTLQSVMHGRLFFHSSTRFHPACSAARSCQDTKPLNYDDNGITGPDWGHSEVVFDCFPIRCFQHFTSLSVTFHSLLVSSTCFLFLFLWFIISAVFLFVNAC